MISMKGGIRSLSLLALLLILLVLLVVGPVGATYLDYYAYGDSIVRGASGVDYGTLPPDINATYIIQMRDNYDPTATANYNTDGGGQSSSWGVTNFGSHWNADGVGIFVINFGINDESDGVPAATCAANLVTLHNLALTNGSVPVIALPVVRTDSAIVGYDDIANQSAYIGTIESALVTAGVNYTRLYDAIDSNPGNNTVDVEDTDYMGDSPHPNQEGYRVMADYLWAYLVDAGRVSAVTPTWLDGYDYRIAYYINGSATRAQAYYQYNFTIYAGTGTSAGHDIYLNGHTLNSMNDIRFTDSTSTVVLRHWYETSNATYAKVWVTIPYIPKGVSNSTKLYIYYGERTAASSSDMVSTFPLGEQFDTFTPLTKWTVTGGNITNAGSVVSIFSNSSTINSIASNSSWYNVPRENMSVVARMKTAHSGNSASREYFYLHYRNTTAYNMARISYSFDYLLYRNSAMSGYDSSASITGHSANTWEQFRLDRYGTADYYINDANKVTIANNYTTGTYGPSRSLYFITQNDKAQIDIDWIFARRFIVPEPANYTEIGAEEMHPPASITGLTNSTPTCNSMSWSYTRPSDSDFDYVGILINGTWGNVSNASASKSLTGLPNNTVIMFNSTTVDLSGNQNLTAWVNSSATTAEFCSSETWWQRIIHWWFNLPAPIFTFVN